MIKEKITRWIQNATQTATDTVKQITKEDAANRLDILGNIAKIGVFAVLVVASIKGASSTAEVVKQVKVQEVVEPAKAVAPVVQIFLGEGKGVRIE